MAKNEDNPDSRAQMSETLVTRDRWSTRLDYLMAMIGYCVGLGNIWRFPYICVRNGGGAFLIPFLFFLIVAALPIFILEAALSQFSGKGPLHIWSFCPLFKGVGVCCVVQTILYNPSYAILVSWPIYYMVKSCSSVLPWTTCDNSWNTPLCVEDISLLLKPDNNTMPSLSSDVENKTTNLFDETTREKWMNSTLSHSAVEEFWQYNVLNISSGMEDVGQIQWHLVGCVLVMYIIILLCLSRGVKSVGKVVYVTALLPYIFLVIIFIRTLTLPGAVKGILYFLTPDFSKLLQAQVWVEACLQVFYSLGVGYGMMGTTSSYNRFNEPCIRDAIIICAVSEGTSIFAGFVTFSVLGVMSTNIGVPVSEVVSSGPGIAFIAYPEALSKLPVPQVWSFIFFFMLLTIGLDSQFLATEIMSTALLDQFPSKMKGKRFFVNFLLCLGCFLFGLIYCTQGGQYILQMMDWYTCAFGFFVVCLVESFCVAWIYGIKQFSKDINMMLGRPPPLLLRLVWCYLSPVIYLVVFIVTLAQYQPPTYGTYTYPDYVNKIGWIIASLPVIPIPIFIIKELQKHKGMNFREKLLLSLQPSPEWVPSLTEYQEEHKTFLKQRPSLKNNVKDTFSLRV